MDSRICQTSTASPAKPGGGSPIGLVAPCRCRLIQVLAEHNHVNDTASESCLSYNSLIFRSTCTKEHVLLMPFQVSALSIRKRSYVDFFVRHHAHALE